MSAPAYGVGHIVWMAGIAGISMVLTQAARREWLPQRAIRAILVVLLVGGELARIPTTVIQFPGTLPLHLCNFATWAGVVACLTLWSAPLEFLYFAGLCGAAMTLLMPDRGSDWPATFFLNHGAIIVTAVTLVFGRIATLRAGAFWWAYGWLLAYLTFAAIFDWKYQVNYGFVRTKPSGTVLDYFGPWPYYVGVVYMVALVMFRALWLLRPGETRKPGTAEAHQPVSQAAALQ